MRDRPAHRRRDRPPVWAGMVRLWVAVMTMCASFGCAQEGSPGRAMQPYTEKIPETEVTFEMLPIEGGEFTMGSPEKEHEFREEHEGRRFRVRVDPFWMGKHEVTWDEFDEYLKLYEKFEREGFEEVPDDRQADAVSIPTPIDRMEMVRVVALMGRGGGFPTVNMTQLAARQYTKWLSLKTGRFYRLPTEAEWEYACRAGTQTAYSFGDDAKELDAYTWYADNSARPGMPHGQFHRVGLKLPNPWGLYDMHGNVAEYVIDQFHADHYEKMAALPQPVPWRDAIAWPSPDEQFKRIVRGGSWFNFSDRLRSASRQWSEKDWRERDPQVPQSIWHHTEALWVGFRIVRPLNEPSEEEKLKFWEPQSGYVRTLMLRKGEPEIRVLLDE